MGQAHPRLRVREWQNRRGTTRWGIPVGLAGVSHEERGGVGLLLWVTFADARVSFSFLFFFLLEIHVHGLVLPTITGTIRVDLRCRHERDGCG